MGTHTENETNLIKQWKPMGCSHGVIYEMLGVGVGAGELSGKSASAFRNEILESLQWSETVRGLKFD